VIVSVSLRFIEGFIAKLFSVVLLSMIVKHYKKEDKIGATSIFSFSFGIGILLGPAVGGVLYRYFGYHGPFIFCSILFFSFLPIFYRVLPEIIDVPRP